jgi:hypothetical protein
MLVKEEQGLKLFRKINKKKMGQKKFAKAMMHHRLFLFQKF